MQSASGCSVGFSRRCLDALRQLGTQVRVGSAEDCAELLSRYADAAASESTGGRLEMSSDSSSWSPVTLRR